MFFSINQGLSEKSAVRSCQMRKPWAFGYAILRYAEGNSSFKHKSSHGPTPTNPKNNQTNDTRYFDPEIDLNHMQALFSFLIRPL